MNLKEFRKNVEDVKPFIAQDGAIVRELFHPDKSQIKNFSLAHGSLEPGQTAKPHKHIEAEEIYYIISGIGKVLIGNEFIGIKTGDAVYVPPGYMHSLENLSSKEKLVVLAIESPAYTDDDTIFKE